MRGHAFTGMEMDDGIGIDIATIDVILVLVRSIHNDQCRRLNYLARFLPAL